MEIEKEKKEYLERECWKCTGYIKHNPVLYPRVGDLFLRELFALANPQCKAPYSRRKKVQMDSIWYLPDNQTFTMYETGCRLAKERGLEESIWLKNGNEIPFFAYWYLICLFWCEAKDYAEVSLSEDWMSRFRKEKMQKGLCKSDSRKYFKAIGLSVHNVASDFPITKNYCPLNRESECKEVCLTEIKVGDASVRRLGLTYREKEELLSFYATKYHRLPIGAVAGELLYGFMGDEYREYFHLMVEQKAFATIPIRFFGCELFSVFAYLTDALYFYSLKQLISGYKQKKICIEELEKEGLWQLSGLLNDKNRMPEHALLDLLILVEEELNAIKGEE